MKILGIDPGPKLSAVVLWRVEEERLLWHEIVPSEHVAQVISDSPPSLSEEVNVAVEHLECHGMAVGRETFETAYFIGEWRYLCRTLDIPFCRIYRSQVKMNLCQSMRARDSNIRQALIDRFGEPGTKKHPGKLHGISTHLWSALAVAITHQDISLNERSTHASYSDNTRANQLAPAH